MLLMGVVIFNSCKDEDGYNWNNYEPVILGEINGPSEVAAHGLADFPYVYKVSYYRGGSSFDWTVTTQSGIGDVIVTPIDVLEAEGLKISVVFPQRSVVDTAIITVVETTSAGVSSEPKSTKVTLNPFCPYDMELFAGDYTGTAAGYHDPTVTMETTDNLNELHVYGLAYFVPESWGENWTDGDGSCVIQFACDDKVVILPQWIGDSDYPDVYGISGSGKVNVDNKVISLDYEVFYGWDGSTGTSAYGVISTDLTLNGKMLKVVKEIQPGKK